MSTSPKASMMMAVQTTGTGGYERLCYGPVPRPEPKPGEVLLRVLAAGVNNTEINTRLGWYSSSVTESTEGAQDGGEDITDGGWSGATPFPLIQGTDCCGEVVAPAPGSDAPPPGTRVIVRASMRPKGWDDPANIWMGSDFDGAFAQYVCVPASEVFAVQCDWSDAELAAIPCAYGTAENMLHRAGLDAGQTVLIAGASGGVGLAAVQLARRRGAHVIAIAGAAKHAAVRAQGAARLLDRNEDVLAALGPDSVDLVVDNVAGPGFGAMLRVLRRRGTYVSSGAIAGPVVSLDMRDMYLKDLRLIGTTGWDAPIFPNLIRYIERGEIRPLIDKTYPLSEIATAQADFLRKRHVGKVVLIPPA